uniref:DUF4780 domain-containing protein n=1 Tax=Rhabditophanes sp. KR3021 TaxID=114890 RepID=A0AC35U3E5_9BILA
MKKRGAPDKVDSSKNFPFRSHEQVSQSFATVATNEVERHEDKEQLEASYVVLKKILRHPIIPNKNELQVMWDNMKNTLKTSQVKIKLIFLIASDDEFSGHVINVLKQLRENKNKGIEYTHYCQFCGEGSFSNSHKLERTCIQIRKEAARHMSCSKINARNILLNSFLLLPLWIQLHKTVMCIWDVSRN